jgi:hypothetical protein
MIRFGASGGSILPRGPTARIALIALFACASLAANAAPPFPTNVRFEVISIDNREIAGFRPTFLVARPAFLDNDFLFDIMPVRYSTGCNNWGVVVKVTGTNQFRSLWLQQTLMYCGDMSQTEEQFSKVMPRVTRWRVDGDILVLEGENGSMRLAPIAQDQRGWPEAVTANFRHHSP